MRTDSYRRFDQEKKDALYEAEQGNFEAAYEHAANAHIIGQRHLITHVEAHLLIQKIARQQGKKSAVAKQYLHLLHAIPASLFKIYPDGNKGLSESPLFEKMPVPEDLQSHI